MERGVADREQRGEDPVHPAGRAHRRLVEQHALAGAEDRAVAARERRSFRAARRGGCARRPARRTRRRGRPSSPRARARDIARRSRQRRTAAPATGAASCRRRRTGAQTLLGRGTKSPAAPERDRSSRDRRRSTLRDGRAQEAEERPRRLSAGLERQRPATGSSDRRPHAAGVRPADRVGIDPPRVPIRRAEQLHRIGGEGAAPSRQPCATQGCAVPWAGSGGSSPPGRTGHAGRRDG